jgi:hypothetical protein
LNCYFHAGDQYIDLLGLTLILESEIMTTIDLILFSLRAGANGLGIGLGIAVALIGVLLLLFTRFSINKKWSGGVKLMFVQALILIVVTMSYLGLQKGSEYISKKEYDLNSELSEDPVWRQTGLVRAWETLTKEGGQSGLTSPDEGGNEISLRSGAEAEIGESYNKPSTRRVHFTGGGHRIHF